MGQIPQTYTGQIPHIGPNPTYRANFTYIYKENHTYIEGIWHIHTGQIPQRVKIPQTGKIPHTKLLPQGKSHIQWKSNTGKIPHTEKTSKNVVVWEFRESCSMSSTSRETIILVKLKQLWIGSPILIEFNNVQKQIPVTDQHNMLSSFFPSEF